MDHDGRPMTRASSRRAFLRTGLAVGAGTIGAGLMTTAAPVFAKASSPTKGDIDILRFLAAIEIIESDLWQQYNELGGIQDIEVPGGTGNPLYTAALQVLDGDMPQYIHDNTDDEFTHMGFLNAFLSSVGATPVDLSGFANIPGSHATGADKTKLRLTNLMQLSVDTSWWERYRSPENPDFGEKFQPVIPSLNQTGAQFPAIPRSDADTKGSTVKKPTDLLQAIANTAGFHFGFIEQGGTSLYPTLAQKVTDATVLRILLSIGPSETMHFQVWHDKAGNAPALTTTIPPTGLTLTFVNLAVPGTIDSLTQANLIMPEPCDFISDSLPHCAIIRPTLDPLMGGTGGAVATVNAFNADGLFIGQKDPTFLPTLMGLATAADNATRGF